MRLLAEGKLLSYVVTLTILIYSHSILAGEQFTEQGGKLTAAINKELIRKDLCKTPRDCNDLLPGYVAHGDRVRIALYEVSEKNGKALNAVVEFIVNDGMKITGGIPITLTGYRETQEEYRNSGLLFKGIKPFLILELNK